jgi:uncharacterized protein DUF3761
MSRQVHRFLLAAVGLVVAVLLSACQSTASPGVTEATDTLSTTVSTTTAAAITTTAVAAPLTTTAPTTTTHHSTKAKPVAPKTTHAVPTKKKSAGACGSGYYRNSDGVCVHRPAPAKSAPAGATAQCKDGTYSYSKHRSGTCSHHGGVARWL